MLQESTTSKALAERKKVHSSDATLSNHQATKAGLVGASNCLCATQKKVPLRDNVYEYCLANCNTMALERKASCSRKFRRMYQTPPMHASETFT
jgi:hypothetical protein